MRSGDIDGHFVCHLTTFFEKGGMAPGMRYLTGTGGEKLPDGLVCKSIMVERSVPAAAMVDVQRVSKALRDGLGNKPSSYKALLTEAQIAAFAQYVSKASGAVK